MSDAPSQGREASEKNLVKFKKGQSGNPGGQPKWLKEVRAALKDCVQEGAGRLLEIIRTGEDKDAIAAVKVAAEYVLQKPKQTHKVEGGASPLAGLTPEQLVAFVRGDKG